MGKYILDSIQEFAAQRNTEFAGLHWKDQVRLYRQIVKRVTKWQVQMRSVFGTPDLKMKPIQRALNGNEPVRATTNAFAYLRWQDGLVSAEELRRINVIFRGACIVQSQEVVQTEKEAVVHYNARMLTDENYFLMQELPSTQSLVVHDPEYTLFDIQIHVPRNELIKESLHQISRAMRMRKKNKAAKPITITSPAMPTGEPFVWNGIITTSNTSDPPVGIIVSDIITSPNTATQPGITNDFANTSNTSNLNLFPNTVTFQNSAGATNPNTVTYE